MAMVCIHFGAELVFFFSFQKNALMGEFWLGMKQGKQVMTCLNWVEKGSGLKWIDRFKVDQA